MRFKAHIQNGAVVLDEPISLADGSKVIVHPVENSTTLDEMMAEFVGKGEDLPSDGSTQHDHYIYGTPKR